MSSRIRNAAASLHFDARVPSGSRKQASPVRPKSSSGRGDDSSGPRQFARLADLGAWCLGRFVTSCVVPSSPECLSMETVWRTRSRLETQDAADIITLSQELRQAQLVASRTRRS